MAVETVRRRTDYFGRHEAWRALAQDGCRCPRNAKFQMSPCVCSSLHTHTSPRRVTLFLCSIDMPLLLVLVSRIFTFSANALQLVRVLLRRGPSTEAESRPPKHYAGVRNMGPPEFHRTGWPKLSAARNCGGCAFSCRLIRWLLYPRLIVDRARDWIGHIAFPPVCSLLFPTPGILQWAASPTMHHDLCNGRLVDREGRKGLDSSSLEAARLLNGLPTPEEP
jgi:hypothetical protein